MTVMEMDGRVAVVTGGGAGIGRAAALALAQRGADVAIVDVDVDRARAVVGKVQALGRTGLAAPADVLDQAAIIAAIDAADARFGRVDILVNNAGGVRLGRFVDQMERSWRKHIDMNFVSMLTATHAAAGVMIRGRDGGAIVNVASIEGSRAAPMFAVYGACKAAMLSFTRTMAVELAEQGIRTNAVAPDWVRTPGNSGLLAGPVPDELPPRPEAIAFLCSPAAS